MAQVVGVFNTAHSPFCYMDPQRWNEVRANRSLREDVPHDDLETNLAKSARIKQGFATLADKIGAVKADAVIVIGDDQLECFDFNNFPAFAIYVGEQFEGHLSQRDTFFGAGRGGIGEAEGRPAIPKGTVKGHPELGTGLLTGLMKKGFDPAFCMDMPKPDRGIGHAILRPVESLKLFDKPVVPILVNCYYAPQPTAMRCYEFGKAMREVIEEFPSDMRVAVVGSGGLWHTPGAKGAYLDEDFDATTLRYLEAGDARGMAEHFDSYHIPSGDSSQYVGERGRQSTGMPGFGGPQGGTRETCNWIIAAGVGDGSRSTIVDYVPVYASPVGAAFTYCDKL